MLDDWVFASPITAWPVAVVLSLDVEEISGRSGSCQAQTFGIHTLRHSYRSWLDAVGTPIAVQQKLMRHADIRTTMNVYGTVVTDKMATASGKVARLTVNGTGSGTGPTPSR